MANAVTANKIYVDSTGSVADTRTYVTYILFTANAANDSITLKETSSGSNSLKLQAATAKDTKIFDFSRKPLVFQNGIYVSALSSSATALIVTSTQGGS